MRDRLKRRASRPRRGGAWCSPAARASSPAWPSWRGAILHGQVRIGRPLGVQGLPEAAKGPAFAAPVGLLVYPQVAQLEHFVPRRTRYRGTGTDGYFSRMGRWIKESF